MDTICSCAKCRVPTCGSTTPFGTTLVKEQLPVFNGDSRVERSQNRQVVFEQVHEPRLLEGRVDREPCHCPFCRAGLGDGRLLSRDRWTRGHPERAPSPGAERQPTKRRRSPACGRHRKTSTCLTTHSIRPPTNRSANVRPARVAGAHASVSTVRSWASVYEGGGGGVVCCANCNSEGL